MLDSRLLSIAGWRSSHTAGSSRAFGCGQARVRMHVQASKVSPARRVQNYTLLRRWLPLSMSNVAAVFAYRWQPGSVDDTRWPRVRRTRRGVDRRRRNFARGHRLSRHVVRHVVDSFLRAANVNAQCRITRYATAAATLPYRYTSDLRGQGMTRMQSPPGLKMES